MIIKKKNKLDFIKIKVIVHKKTLSRKWKETPTEREKIFAHRISNEAVIFRICKELLQLNETC